MTTATVGMVTSQMSTIVSCDEGGAEDRGQRVTAHRGGSGGRSAEVAGVLLRQLQLRLGSLHAEQGIVADGVYHGLAV